MPTKEETKEYNHSYREKHHEKLLERERLYKIEHHEYIVEDHHRYYVEHRGEKGVDHHRSMVEHYYGISEEEYDQMSIFQGGKCAACGKENSGQMRNGEYVRMFVDHDHTTGKVRGLLCNNCNSALGHVHDNPELLLKLAAYLNREAHEKGPSGP